MVNDLLLAADSRQMSALCLLDLTAAFDTVDHELLISRLERQFGLRGVVLEWFRSSGRTFRVVFSGSTSSIIYIVCSVPQGSVLGPLFFHCPDSGPCSYSEEARRISTRVCRRHAAVSTLSSHRHGVSCCTAGTVITDVGRWMCANRLKLNADKTELLWGRIETQSFPARRLSSSSTTRFLLHSSS